MAIFSSQQPNEATATRSAAIPALAVVFPLACPKQGILNTRGRLLQGSLDWRQKWVTCEDPELQLEVRVGAGASYETWDTTKETTPQSLFLCS